MSRRRDEMDEARYEAQLRGGDASDYMSHRGGGNGSWKNYKSGEVRGGNVVESYIYQDKDRKPYLMVERTEDKQFPQSHWNGREWKYGKPKGPKIPYMLPELLAAPPGIPIFICEGEKDADNVYNLGLTSTCASEGAGKWTKDLNPWFKGKQTAYIMEDNDKPGRQHAFLVAANLRGIVGQIKIVSLPGLAENGDVSDWIEARDAEGLTVEQIRDQLLQLCSAAKEPDSDTAIIQQLSGEVEWREKNTKGLAIPSMHNARLAITALGIECSYDEFHNKMLVGFRDDNVRHELQSVVGEVSDNVIIRLRVILSAKFRSS
jgi:hypothetical protein